MKTIIFDLDGTLVRLQPQLVLIADVYQLTSLRKSYAFALVSGGKKREVLDALDKTGLRFLFEDALIVTFEDTNQEKASGEPFREIQQRLQGNMVMIGDSESDALGTKVAELSFVKVPTYQDLQEQRKALAAAIGQALHLLK